MTMLDKVIASVTPMESDESRKEARVKAKTAARSAEWLAMVLQHHEHIEAAFAAVKAATTTAQCVAAQKGLGNVLMGHAIAEEAVLYPALAIIDEKSDAETAYSQQAEAKMQMAMLDVLAPMSKEYAEKLEDIRVAVAHHVYEEEGTWFLELAKKAPAAVQAKLALQYREEFDKYFAGAKTPIAAAHRADAMD
jgi:hypothetical protein